MSHTFRVRVTVMTEDAKSDSEAWTSRLSAGMTPTILRVCKDFATEGAEMLYGLNTFFADIQTMYSNNHAPCFPIAVSDEGSRLFCLRCTNNSVARYVQLRPNRVSAQKEVKTEYQPMWNPNTIWIRRLQVSLRPYTYYEFSRANTLYRMRSLPALVKSESLSPVESCVHCFQDALPTNMKLELLILHIGRPALIAAEEEEDNEI